MKLLLRALRLLFGLIYRLIVLVLFERWIPFPERAPAAPAEPRRVKSPRQAGAAVVPARGARAQTQSAGAPPAQTGQPLSSAAARSAAPTFCSRAVRDSTAHRPLRALLRDRQVLRDALLLDAALAPRRSRF
jgi:hypothetical protein